MELTRKKFKSHKVEKPRDQVLATEEALEEDQRSSPEADNPMTGSLRPSPRTKKSREQVLANQQALMRDQRSNPEANYPMTEDPRSSPATKKSREEILANKEAISADQRSSPKADTLKTEDKKSSPENHEVPRTYEKSKRPRGKIILSSTIPKDSTEKDRQRNSVNTVKDLIEKIKMEKKNSEEDLTIQKFKDTAKKVERRNSVNNVKDIFEKIKMKKKEFRGRSHNPKI